MDKVYKAIEAIEYVQYTDESKDKINAASALYEELSEENKAKITNYDTLKTAEDRYNTLSNDYKTKIIMLIIILGSVVIVIGLVVVYILMFFVFNKYVIIKSKKTRVFRIGMKGDKVRLLKKNFRIIYRNEEDVYNNKR